MASTVVTEPDRELRHPEVRTAARRFPLPDHLILLQRDQVGRPMAALQHAALVVLIRREIALDAALARYFELWETHTDLLLTGLSLRWLISAADSFADHGRTDGERAAGFAASLFANTIKLYETERHYLMDIPVTDGNLEDNVPPFDLDGITAFRPSGDSIGNLFKRKDRVVEPLGAAGRILSRVMQRAGEIDTVYARMRDFHTGKNHKW